MTAHAGPRLIELLATTGITEERVPQIARDTLRIRTYLANRFPTVPVSDADAEDYFKAHPEEVRPGGVALTFEQAAADARAAVAAERRARRIEQWLMNLRERVEVSIVP